MRTWLFQGNPDLWPVLDVLAAGQPIDSWSAVRHLAAITPGDRALLWVSGRVAGVYAVGRVIGVAEPETTDHRWTEPTRRGVPRHAVPLHLTTLPHPVPRDELKADPRFARSQIIRAPRGGNPFPVTDQEWAAVADRLPEERPPEPPAVRSATSPAASRRPRTSTRTGWW